MHRRTLKYNSIEEPIYLGVADWLFYEVAYLLRLILA